MTDLDASTSSNDYEGLLNDESPALKRSLETIIEEGLFADLHMDEGVTIRLYTLSFQVDESQGFSIEFVIGVHIDEKGEAAGWKAVALGLINRVTSVDSEGKPTIERRGPQIADEGWKLVDSYGVPTYQCGLRAGQQLTLRKAIVVRDTEDQPTGEIHSIGEHYMVLTGSVADPGVVWLRQSDGGRCTWDDSTEIFEWFEVIGHSDE